jgi:AcrR family transcriptional regulator
VTVAGANEQVPVETVLGSMTGPVEERTRMAIETCALQLFVERGYSATTIDDIADRAKVAPSIITRHFQTKEFPKRDLISTGAAGEGR